MNYKQISQINEFINKFDKSITIVPIDEPILTKEDGKSLITGVMFLDDETLKQFNETYKDKTVYIYMVTVDSDDDLGDIFKFRMIIE